MTSLEELMALSKFGIKLGLENMQKMLKYCDDFHTKLNIIHIAGTNGKGSTSAMIAKMIELSGKTVAVYNSPFVTKLNENYRINDQLITDEELEKYAQLALEIRKKTGVDATHYEVCTLIMLLWANDINVDYLILEVGLGGRFDATNIVDPILSIITNVSYDHVQILGNTLTEIASEKCGIIKPNVPLLIGQNITELVNVAKSITNDYFICETLIEDVQLDYENYQTNITIDNKKYTLNLFGYHQSYNMAISYRVAKMLNIEEQIFVEMLKKVKWPYRFEVVSKSPLCILDGAHNEAAMLELKKVLEYYNPGEIQIIFSALKDKDILKMAEILKTITKNIIVTSLDHVDKERGLSAQAVKEALNYDDCQVFSNPNEAFDQITEAFAVNIVCGSFKLLELYKMYEANN